MSAKVLTSRDFSRYLVYLLFVAAVVLAAGIGLRDPWLADEPRFALIAKEMYESGNWLIPHAGGVLYPDKPPLFFWLVAALYALTGSIKTSILIPGFVAGLGTILLVADLGRRLHGPRAGLWSGAILLAALQFPLQMKSGQVDGLLCFWTTLSLYGLCRHMLLGPDWRWYAIGGAAAGLGIITKSAGILPYLIAIPYLFALARGWRVVRTPSWRWAVAPAVSILVISLWLVPMLLATSGGGEQLAAYRDDMLFHQAVTGYADAWGHFNPPWYLFSDAVPWLWLPVTALLPWLVPLWVRDLKKRNPATLLLGAWVVLVLLFFSMSMGKRSVYMFPALPAFALLAGAHASKLAGRNGVRILLVALPALVGSLLVATAVYAVWNPQVSGAWIDDVPTMLKASLALAAVGFAVIVAMIVAIVTYERARLPAGYAAAMVTFWVGLSLLVAPALNDSRSGKTIMDAVAGRVDAATPLALVARPEQFLLQLDRPLIRFAYSENADAETVQAAEWLTRTPSGKILLPSTHAEPCFDTSKTESVGTAHRRKWLLADESSLTENCRQSANVRVAVMHYPRPAGDPDAGS